VGWRLIVGVGGSDAPSVVGLLVVVGAGVGANGASIVLSSLRSGRGGERRTKIVCPWAPGVLCFSITSLSG